jgi:hypothetical protein
MNDILENKIREIGREKYSLMGHEVPSLFDRKSWNGRLTEWVMKDEPLKVRLFRFVDVLPCLKTDSMVTKVLNEYFSDLSENPFIKGIGAVSGLAPFLAARAVRTGVQSMAAQFVAGRDEYDAMKVFLKLRKQAIAFSAELLGEVVLSDKEASEYAERYKKLISCLSEETSNWHEDPTLDFDTHGPIPMFDVSLKISSFCPHIDPMDWEDSIENAIAGLSSVVIMATKLGGSITLDIDEGAVHKIQVYIELGKNEAKTLLVRNVDLGDGHFVGPVIFTEVEPDSRLAQEEIFGPVLVVMRTPNLDGALEIANDTPYALTGGMFSRSPANIEKAKDNFRVGNLYINRKITGTLVGRQPFGGFGMSGIGYKAGGPDYLPQFMNAKSVSENTLRRGFAPSGPEDN